MRMKRLFALISSVSLFGGVWAQNRFPKPDFESGYKYPEIHYPVPDEVFWNIVDIATLTALISIVAWAVIKKRTRKPVLWVSISAIAYFGFFRSGCVCSIGSIQNISLALVDNTYLLPLSVFMFFMLPILFAFLFGRVFCGGVCPFGAIQDLLNVKNYQPSKAVAGVLGIVPWIYLAFSILYAVTRTGFIICRYDPFIGIFRLGGDVGLIFFGVLLLLASVFTGRPFCRFICPYGALLSLFSRVSIFKIKLTTKNCIGCELCHNACPIDAIKPPYDNRAKESRQQGVKRISIYFMALPLLTLAGAILMRTASENLSMANKEVRLYDMVTRHESDPSDIIPLEAETFYGKGRTIEDLKQNVEKIQAEFKSYSTVAGAFIGLVVGIAFIGFSIKRTRTNYEIDRSACVSCGKCFKYCPWDIDKPDTIEFYISPDGKLQK